MDWRSSRLDVAADLAIDFVTVLAGTPREVRAETFRNVDKAVRVSRGGINEHRRGPLQARPVGRHRMRRKDEDLSGDVPVQCLEMHAGIGVELCYVDPEVDGGDLCLRDQPITEIKGQRQGLA